MAIAVTYYAATLTSYQNNLLHNADLPQFVIEQVQLIDPKTHFATENQVRIYNYGKLVHDLSVEVAAFVRLDDPTIHFRNGRVPLNGYLDIVRSMLEGQNLLATIDGINNNLLFINLSKNFEKERGSFLVVDVYFQLAYTDALEDNHIDYYKLGLFEGVKIDNTEGTQAFKDFDLANSINLQTATYADLAKFITTS